MEDLREYYISQESYTDTYFRTNVDVSPIDGTTGEQRFYILELENRYDDEYSTYYYLWYYGARSTYGGTDITDYSTVTSTDFGAGITNSATFKPLWKQKHTGRKIIIRHGMMYEI